MNWTMPTLAPAFPLRWQCHASEGVELAYETDEAAVRQAIAGKPFEFVTARVVFYAGTMLRHDLGATHSWRFSSLSLPVRFRGAPGLWSIFMFADDAQAILAGRELLGEPKKWGDMQWQHEGAGIRFELGLLGEAPVRLRAEIGAARKGSAVAGPLGLTGPVPLLNHRLIPSPLAGERAAEQIVAVKLDATFQYRELRVSEFALDQPADPQLDTLLAPMHAFPVREMIAANFREGGFENGAGPNCQVYPIGDGQGVAMNVEDQP